MEIEDKYIQTKNKITYFDEDLIQEISLPKKFTYPFYYTPHPLVKLATEDLQNYLENDFKVNHNFGLNGENTENAIGKMFGVLVVQDKNGRDRKSTRLNSSHVDISYAVFCLKKKHKK